MAYRRPLPPEWPMLEATANSMISPTVYYTDIGDETKQRLRSHVDNLSNEALETNAYYGFGHGICVFARQLNNPYIENHLVLQGSRDLARASSKNEFPGVQIGDIATRTMRNPFIALALLCMNSIETPRRLAIETCSDVLVERRLGAALSQQPLQELRKAKMEAGELTAEIIGVNGLAGATGMLRRALLTISAQRGLTPSHKIYVRQLFDSARVDRLDLTKASLQAALLRLDEFTGSVLPQTLSVENNIAALDRTLLPVKPDTRKHQQFDQPHRFLHEERLFCPAVQVQGMIPRILGIVPRIIINAENNIYRVK